MAKTGGRTRRRTKDRVLQARIPEDLDRELRDRAEQLGLSVSTVVRNVLLHTFDLVEGVVTDSAQLARVVQGREARRTPSALPRADATEAHSEAAVIGWQEAILNRNGVCEQCNAILARGERAAIGVPVSVRPVLLCLSCLAELSPAVDSEESAQGSTPAQTPRRGRKSNN